MSTLHSDVYIERILLPILLSSMSLFYAALVVPYFRYLGVPVGDKCS